MGDVRVAKSKLRTIMLAALALVLILTVFASSAVPGAAKARNKDRDQDGVRNALDNCPYDYNPAPQIDSDGDGIGDACDPTPLPPEEPPPPPPPPPDPDPDPLPGTGTLFLSDTCDRDADTFVPPWYQTIQAAPGRITTTTEQVRKGTYSCKFSVLSSDNPNGWGSRADLVGPTTGAASIAEGDERWIGWSLLLPSNFQSQLSSRGWILLAEHGYATSLQPRVAYYFLGGPVGSGSSIFEMEIRPGTSNTPVSIFQMQPTYGAWMDVVAHYKFSTDPSIGYIELWINGTRQTFLNGSQRYYTNTLEPGATNNGKIQHANYRAAGSMGSSITLYQDEIKMGDSYAVVAP
jgi:hypothetical protein